MRFILWIFRAAVFFVLFAFALNNQHPVELNWFFGRMTHAPMVLVVLVTFAAGCAVGVISMLPGWWRQHRRNRALESAVPRLPSRGAKASVDTPVPPIELPHPPRDGL
ncbi:MAG: lipopolysaccharide assembly LapA domain-containing protein [Leptothrix sp. (in: b-proteobacteria)]